jgi:hypothetical protein
VLFIGKNPNPSNSYYLSLEGGINTWHIDSHANIPLSNNEYIKPVSIIKFGKNFREVFFELGAEAVSLDTSKVSFINYKESNTALFAAFGFRDFGRKK